MTFPRHVLKSALRLAKGFPILALTGPRQAGKTTLARMAFGDKSYVSLEDPEEREFALTDPRNFLARFPQGAILDEIQRVPSLFSYLQGLVDARQRMGDFILTGSQQFSLHAGISQSLAGRVGLLQLLPFSMGELADAEQQPAALETQLLIGGYPPLYDRPIAPPDWLGNYVATYLERDVRALLAVRDLTLFQRFLKMCAARSGQLLNLSALAADCGISHVTAREWLSVLEASYVVHLLRPWHNNLGKRLVKTPKLYFLDTGLLAWLLGIHDAATLSTHAQRGALFETLIVVEFIKHACNAGRTAELYFWRDSNGQEVDLLVQQGTHMRPVEIKSGATFASDWLRSVTKWRALAGELAAPSWIVWGGLQSYSREGCEVVAWRDLALRLEQTARG